MNNEENNMTLVQKNNNETVITTLEQISKPLEEFVASNDLPTINVLASNEEKAKLFNNFSLSISSLPVEIRNKSDYLTKFIVAGAVGLFDGALNFLWDEIIRTLREKIIQYDLAYFYSIAEQINFQYKKLSSPEDLEAISDYDLLQILKRINFLDDFAFNTLSNINYLRNHASAAHPNVNELTGIKLSSLLEDGIRYAIMLEPDASSIEVKKLFNNIRTVVIPDEDFDDICEDLLKLSSGRIDDFVISLFGLYCDIRTDEFVQKNILEISKRVWENISEQVKYKIGAKYGYYRKNGFVEQKDRVNYYLENVKGLKYRDDDSIVADLIDKLNQLKSIHFRMNNFYNEYPYIRDIAETIPSKGVPTTIKNTFVKTICLCYAGNGNGYRDGVDEDAAVIYEQMIKKFGNEEIKEFILLFRDAEFTIDFGKTKVKQRVKDMCDMMRENTSNNDLLHGLAVISEARDVQKVFLLSDYQRVEEKIKEN